MININILIILTANNIIKPTNKAFIWRLKPIGQEKTSINKRKYAETAIQAGISSTINELKIKRLSNISTEYNIFNKIPSG